MENKNICPKCQKGKLNYYEWEEKVTKRQVNEDGSIGGIIFSEMTGDIDQSFAECSNCKTRFIADFEDGVTNENWDDTQTVHVQSSKTKYILVQMFGGLIDEIKLFTDEKAAEKALEEYMGISYFDFANREDNDCVEEKKFGTTIYCVQEK